MSKLENIAECEHHKHIDKKIMIDAGCYKCGGKETTCSYYKPITMRSQTKRIEEYLLKYGGTYR
jgi:hypothetical protein